MPAYRDIDLDAPEYEPMMGYSSDYGGDEDIAAWLASRDSGAAYTSVPDDDWTTSYGTSEEPA